MATPSSVKAPDKISVVEYALIAQAGVKNSVTIEKPDGSKQKVDGYIKDGVTYVADRDSKGNWVGGVKLVDWTGTSNESVYKNDGKTSISGSAAASGSGYAWETTIKLPKEEPKVVTPNPTAPTPTPTPIKTTPRIEREDPPERPEPPRRPSYVNFNEPQPTFSSNIQRVSKSSYFYGFDNIAILKKNVNPYCCFISKDIHIGSLSEGEYIQLDIEYASDENSAVEFYIIDNGELKPIISVSDTIISNEKIFFGHELRFKPDDSKPITIKKDGVLTALSFNQAKNMNDGLYTATYTPENIEEMRRCKPMGDKIKIKVVQRLYDLSATAPYIKRIRIRKYGGNALWKEDISIQ